MNFGDLTLNRTKVTGNPAGYDGGGIFNAGTFPGTLTLNDSSVRSNSARYGGGIFNNNGTLVMSIWSSVSGNTADSDADGQASGGGIANCGNVLPIGAIEGGERRRNHLGDGTENDIVNACA